MRQKDSHKQRLNQSSFVLFIILKCNLNSSFLINPCFHTFNRHLQVLIMNKKYTFLSNFLVFFYKMGERALFNTQRLFFNSGRWQLSSTQYVSVLYEVFEKNTLLSQNILNHPYVLRILLNLKIKHEVFILIYLILSRQ